VNGLRTIDVSTRYFAFTSHYLAHGLIYLLFYFTYYRITVDAHTTLNAIRTIYILCPLMGTGRDLLSPCFLLLTRQPLITFRSVTDVLQVTYDLAAKWEFIQSNR